MTQADMKEHTKDKT